MELVWNSQYLWMNGFIDWLIPGTTPEDLAGQDEAKAKKCVRISSFLAWLLGRKSD